MPLIRSDDYHKGRRDNRRTPGDVGRPSETGAKYQLPHELVGEAVTQVAGVLDLSWRIRVLVAKAAEISWGLRNVAAKTAAISWRIANAVRADLSITWRIRTTARADLATSWRITNTLPVGATLDLGWAIQSVPAVGVPVMGWTIPLPRKRKPVGATLYLRSRIRATLERAVHAAWRVRRSNVVRLRLGWRVQDPVLDTTWYGQLLEEVDEDLAIAHNALRRAA